MAATQLMVSSVCIGSGKMAVPMELLAGDKAERFMAAFQRTDPGYRRARFGAIGCTLGAQYAAGAADIKAFQVRPDDVWVVTPPKCGTTWTQEMVWLLIHDFDYEGAKALPLYKRSPFLEFTRFAPKKAAQSFWGDVDTVEWASKLPSPRLLKSHLPKELLPDQLWTVKPKIIYVARELKDVAVSYYYHDKMLGGFSADKEFYFDCFYDGFVEHGPIWEHILDFWKMRDEPNILFNLYEDMKKDLPAVVRRTAAFLGKSVTEEQLTRLVDHLDIKKMRDNPSVNFEETISQMRKAGAVGQEERFIRKGVVGEGRREMSPEMAAKFDAKTRQIFGKNAPWQI